MSNGKYLTFVLESESYGIPILQVREIIGSMMEITHVPKMPEFVKGVINLRGKLIPVMDLRLKFGFTEQSYTNRTSIIVVDVEKEGEIRQNGLVVDTVSEVLSIEDDNIENPPEFGESVDESFLTGLAKFRDKVILLIETEKIFSEEEIDLIEEIS